MLVKFLLDENLPKAEQLFSPYGSLNWFSGRVPPAALLCEAEILLVRSVTTVNKALLDKAPNLKFVGTATIGTEHIDTVELKRRGIGFASAPGSNAIAVGEYVLAAVLAMEANLQGLSAAIIGAGHTGKETARCLSAFGVHCSFYDPPLEKRNLRDEAFQRHPRIAFDDIFEHDIISFHVPLTLEGNDATWHLFDQNRVESLKSGTILVNASRGGVIDNRALLNRQQRDNDLKLALDVWENEPEVLKELVEYTAISTPHIAGHSIEGKIRGVYSLFDSVAEYLNWPKPVPESEVLPASGEKLVLLKPEAPWRQLRELVLSVTQITLDTERFRNEGLSASGFDNLRRNRNGRREFSAYRLSAPELVRNQVARSGFKFECSEDTFSNR